MPKIKVKNPLVELDGDEMTRIIWQLIKEKLIEPHLDIDLRYYDLGIENRDTTEDAVTMEAARAIEEFGVGVKCATITANADRVKEYTLKKEWPSPNGTIRASLDGTVFRKPIMVKGILPAVRTWTKPIVIARHAYGDLYKNVEARVMDGDKAELVLTSTDSEERRIPIHMFKGSSGIVLGMHNTDASIRSFAQACIAYALSEKMDLWFAAKDTISKTYHTRFREIFAEEEDKRRAEFENAGISTYYTLIDDAVSRIMRHEGGFLWACMNYDGDVFSDMLASGFGSLGLMTSVLVSPKGVFEYEAAHGTVQKHYYRHLKGEQTSTNSTASIFAWTGALRKRGELDETPDVVLFADRLERAVIDTIESGVMTGDLVRLMENSPDDPASTEGFIAAIASRL